MKQYNNLYARDSKGRIKSFELTIFDNASTSLEDIGIPLIVRKTGLLNGKKQEYKSIVRKGKAGRSLREQAELEANSKYNKKLDEGYKTLQDVMPEPEFKYGQEHHVLEEYLEKYLPKTNTDASGNFKPMLAQPIKKQNILGYLMQPKLNGVRCLIFKEGDEIKAISRKGKSYDVATRFIREQLAPLFEENDSVIFDGEIYIHGVPLQKISGWVRKQEPILEHKSLEYHIYDLIDKSLPEADQEHRLEMLDSGLEMLGVGAFLIRMVTTAKIPTLKIKDEFHSSFIEQGYEGSILRNPKGLYESGVRSKNLLKLKDFIDEEFEIVGHELGERGTEDLVFVCKQEEGKTFKVKPMGTRAVKEEYYNVIDSLMGKNLTTRYFERTEDNIPHHAHGVAIRDYE